MALLGQYREFRVPVIDHHAINTGLETVIDAMERCYNGSVKSYVGKAGEPPVIPVDYTGIKFTATVYGGMIGVAFPLPVSPRLARGYFTDDSFHQECMDAVYPAYSPGHVYDDEMRYTHPGSGERIRVRMTYLLNGAGKSVQFHARDEIGLAQILDIMLDTNIRDSVYVISSELYEEISMFAPEDE